MPNRYMVIATLACGHSCCIYDCITREQADAEKAYFDIRIAFRAIEPLQGPEEVCQCCGVTHGNQRKLRPLSDDNMELSPYYCETCGDYLQVMATSITMKWLDNYASTREQWRYVSRKDYQVEDLKRSLSELKKNAHWMLRSKDQDENESRYLDRIALGNARLAGCENLKRTIRKWEKEDALHAERALVAGDDQKAKMNIDQYYEAVKMRRVPSLQCFSDSIVFKYFAPIQVSRRIEDEIRAYFFDAYYRAYGAGDNMKKKFDLESFDWSAGTCKMRGDRRIHRLGKKLREVGASPELIKAFETRTMEEWRCHITSDQWDVLHMSTGQGWTSCMQLGSACQWGPVTEGMKGSMLLKFFRPGDTKPCGREILRPSYIKNGKTGKISPVVLRGGKVYGTGLNIEDSILSDLIGVPVMKKSEDKEGLLLGAYDDNGGRETRVVGSANGLVSAMRQVHKVWANLAHAWQVPVERQEKFFKFFGVSPDTRGQQWRDLAPPVEFAGDVW